MGEIKIEIDSALLKEIKDILRETFEIEKTEKRTLERKIRTAYFYFSISKLLEIK